MEKERRPPTKIRVSKLQEAQVSDLVRMEQAAAERFAEIGVAVEARSATEIARMPRNHDVLVAEADHEPAGYLAWADEAPGVAHLVTMVVDPELQRFGVGTRLLRELGESAVTHGIAEVVVACSERATWAMAFLAVRGFRPVADGKLPGKVKAWAEERGREVLVPGQKLWWRESDGLGLIPGLPRPDSSR